MIITPKRTKQNWTPVAKQEGIDEPVNQTVPLHPALKLLTDHIVKLETFTIMNASIFNIERERRIIADELVDIDIPEPPHFANALEDALLRRYATNFDTTNCYNCGSEADCDRFAAGNLMKSDAAILCSNYAIDIHHFNQQYELIDKIADLFYNKYNIKKYRLRTTLYKVTDQFLELCRKTDRIQNKEQKGEHLTH